MNQSVIFNDDAIFMDDKGGFAFSVQAGGALFSCWLPLSVLESVIEIQGDPLVAFHQQLFLIEEAAEEALEEETFDGEVLCLNRL